MALGLVGLKNFVLCINDNMIVPLEYVHYFAQCFSSVSRGIEHSGDM